MKKTISLLIAIIVILSLPSLCFADNTKTFTLTEAGITISIPADYYVLTRDITSYDPALSFYDMTRADCISFLESGSI